MTPRDYDGLRATLIARAAHFPKRLAQVARFLLNHPEDVALNTLTRLSTLAEVPPATLTRFAKELGFQGYADLQSIFRERLLGPDLPYAARLSENGLSETPPDLDQPTHVFSSFVQAAIHSLHRIDADLNRQSLDAFVDALVTAQAIHVAAARGAFGLGAYSVYGLAKVGKRAHLIDNLGAMRDEQAAAIGPDDALLVMTFGDYTPESIAVTQSAHAKGRLILAITDNELSPVVPLAAHVLYVNEARLGHFRSQVPAMVVAQAIIVSLGRRLGQAL